MFFAAAIRRVYGLLLLSQVLVSPSANSLAVRYHPEHGGRERINLNADWRFQRTESNPDGLAYDDRPDLNLGEDVTLLKPWILPSANRFISDPADHHERPDGNPGGDVEFVQADFDDSDWEPVTLPHDWAIKGPFYTEEDPIIGGGMGRLPVHGVGWYRRRVAVTPNDKGRKIYLDVDGAMSYAMVWLNGNLVGGWPYGYNSFRLDLTPHLEEGEDNQLAIRLDNPPDSARWYPGGGLYRSIWLTKVNSTHIGQFGTFVTSRDISEDFATVDMTLEIDNGAEERVIRVTADVYELDSESDDVGKKVVEFPHKSLELSSNKTHALKLSTKVNNPKLWGPTPSQTPNRYVVVARLYDGKDLLDTYETRFGIRDVQFTGEGLVVNGKKTYIQGVNQHHDLGALGAAFNRRAAQRQLEVLRDLGCNAIRMAHNPPAAELLELTDSMGFLVVDEIFDSFYKKKDGFRLSPDFWGVA